MSIEWFPCGICENTICDVGTYYTCANCEGPVCENCYTVQLKKYKRVKRGSDEADDYGDDALRECDQCSDKTLKSRIEMKENELTLLKSKLN